MDLSIVIVNWNAGKYLEKCVASIYQYRPSCEMEIIVVDNASTDGSPDRLRQQFPEVSVLVNEENVGFARANNQAIQCSSGRYLLLLNPDTELFPDTISILVDFFRSHPSAGMIGPRLLNTDGSLQSSCYPFPTPIKELWRLLHLDELYPFGVYRQRRWDLARTRSVDSLQGACLLVPRSVLDKVGLFDERYFIYTEEIDLCYRIKQAGWENLWVPTAAVVHHGGQSTRQVASRMFIQLYHSKLQFFRKHYGKVRSWLYKLVLLVTALCRLVLTPLALLLSSIQRKNNLEMARNYFHLIRALPGL